MTKENKDKLFGDTPIVQSDGVFRSLPIPDSDLEFGQKFQARAKLTLSDGTQEFTNATTFTLPRASSQGFVLPTTTTTTTTSTTTVKPVGFFEDAGNAVECPCGTITLPAGKKFDSKGMFLELVGKKDSTIVTRTVSLLHSQIAHVETQQTFTTVTDVIPVSDFDQITSAVVVINSDGQGPSLSHVISVKVKDLSTSEQFGHQILGLFGQSTTIYNTVKNRPQINIPLHGNSLSSNFIIEFESLCDFYEPECCDQLPEIAASGYKFLCLPLQDNFSFPLPTYEELNPTTTTIAPSPPVEIRPILPD
tara:strand:+ start:3779 stop:4696 length:918 start_codon:yes stop_codon:yes gene_type:complete